MKKDIKYWIAQIFKTWIGWIILLAISLIVFGVLANYYDWVEWVVFASVYGLAFIILVFMVYAWIINPYKEYRKYKDGNIR